MCHRRPRTFVFFFWPSSCSWLFFWSVPSPPPPAFNPCEPSCFSPGAPKIVPPPLTPVRSNSRFLHREAQHCREVCHLPPRPPKSIKFQTAGARTEGAFCVSALPPPPSCFRPAFRFQFILPFSPTKISLSNTPFQSQRTQQGPPGKAPHHFTPSSPLPPPRLDNNALLPSLPPPPPSRRLPPPPSPRRDCSPSPRRGRQDRAAHDRGGRRFGGRGGKRLRVRKRARMVSAACRAFDETLRWLPVG